jgi:ATP-dependent DNA helicase RecG
MNTNEKQLAELIRQGESLTLEFKECRRALNPATFTPYPKNPVIGSFFREIHRADELGSGMRNMMKYGKAYGGADPEMVEGDVFRSTVKFPDTSLPAVSLPLKPEAQSKAQSKDQSSDIVKVLRHTPCSANELVVALGLKSKTGAFKRSLQDLIEQSIIEYTNPEKPASRMQKYRLTSKGLEVLDTLP